MALWWNLIAHIVPITRKKWWLAKSDLFIIQCEEDLLEKCFFWVFFVLVFLVPLRCVKYSVITGMNVENYSLVQKLCFVLTWTNQCQQLLICSMFK